MEDYIKYEIPAFNIKFQYPEWWDDKIEHENTYLFWDEYTGSFRITPATINLPNFNLEQFLENRFRENANANAEWKIYNGRKFLYYETLSHSGDESTKLHFYISGNGNTLITCSFAYDNELLSDEYSNDEVEGALEEVENILQSLTL
ncbi:MAG: DUF3805 domain-containing protein [Bacteroidia bacterium]